MVKTRGREWGKNGMGKDVENYIYVKVIILLTSHTASISYSSLSLS